MQMYNVSLLPKEYRMLHSSTRKKNIALVSSIIVMAVLLVAYLILTVIISGNSLELKGIKAENGAIVSQINSLVDLKTLNEDVNIMLNDVEEAMGTSPHWDDLIIKIGNSAPPTISVSNYTVEYEPDSNSGSGSIVGMAANNEAISWWLVSLEDIDELSQITFKHSTKSSEDEKSPVNFEIKFTVNEGPGYILPVEVVIYE